MMVAYAARSHIGNVREKNEDNLFVNGVYLPDALGDDLFSLNGCTVAPAVFAVCDGMGGESDGAAASCLAVETLAAFQDRILRAKPRQLHGAVCAYVKSANEVIAGRTAAGSRMGTTLALAVVLEQGVYCFSMGDSRIYVQSRRTFRQVTNDHTVAAERARLGMGHETADCRMGQRLTRCIGIGRLRDAEAYAPLPPAGRLLLCSDGLSHMVCTAELQRLLAAGSSPGAAADALLEVALQCGGRDNITVIVMDLEPQQRAERLQKLLDGNGKRRRTV